MIYVYQLNECDWYAGKNAKDAIRCAMSDTGMTRAEVVDKDAFHRLTEKELETSKFMNEERTRYIGTFADILADRIHRDDKFPSFFASTEA